MLAWLAENAATILIAAALAVLVFFIVRGLIRGNVKACGDCGGGCSACQYGEACQSRREATR